MDRLIPGRTDEALRSKVVDLVGRIACKYAEHRSHVGDITVRDLDSVQHAKLAQSPQRVASPARCQSDDAIAFCEQKSREIGTVLSGDAGDECDLIQQLSVLSSRRVCRPVSSRA